MRAKFWLQLKDSEEDRGIYSQLAEVIPELPATFDEWYEKLYKDYYADLDLILPITTSLHISKVYPKNSIGELMQKLTEKLEEIGPLNERCNVTVGGNNLLSVNEVLYREDCCTDALQADLDAGYRVLAVCVQPDQRRPDYILGKI